jgi:hypothetical protein
MWNSLGVGIDTKYEDNMESRIRKTLLVGKGVAPSTVLYFLFSFLFFPLFLKSIYPCLRRESGGY